MGRDRVTGWQNVTGWALATRQRHDAASWWAMAALAAVVLAASAGTAGAQAPVVPDKVDPAPTLPPGAGGDRGSSVPRSETPLAPDAGARPLPDGGVVVTPPMAGSTPVIRPPATGSMPVIAPPGSPGGDRTVVPK